LAGAKEERRMSSLGDKAREQRGLRLLQTVVLEAQVSTALSMPRGLGSRVDGGLEPASDLGLLMLVSHTSARGVTVL